MRRKISSVDSRFKDGKRIEIEGQAVLPGEKITINGEGYVVADCEVEQKFKEASKIILNLKDVPNYIKPYSGDKPDNYMSPQDKLYLALEALVDISEEFQKTITSYSHNLQWAKEICTVKICTARHAGHSSAAFKIASRFDSTIIITKSPYEYRHNKYICQLATDLINEKNLFIESIETVLAWIKTQHKNRIQGIKFQAVIVDCASLLSCENFDDIYAFWLPFMEVENDFYFIFLE